MELSPARLNHVILYQDSLNQDHDAGFSKLCHHLAGKMPIIMINCFEACHEVPEGNVLIAKPEFTIFSKLTPEIEATRHFGYHRYFIYGEGKNLRTALVYLTDIVGSSRVFVVNAQNLHYFVTPLMLVVKLESEFELYLSDSENRFVAHENLMLLEELCG